MRFVYGLPILVALAVAPLSFAANDWLIVPGTRVGPITANAVPADLRRLFPEASIKDDEIELDEGMLQPATLVYNDNASERLAVSWTSKGPDAHPKQIFVCWGRRRGPCRWQASGGIRVGTRLKDLEVMNGKPFMVSGFGWNYGGNVLSWDAGALDKLDCGGRVVLTLDGERTGPGRYTVGLTSEESHSITGDKPVASGTPAMQKVNPAVVAILYQFPGSDSRKCE
jgi:hypothetical protein